MKQLICSSSSSSSTSTSSKGSIMHLSSSSTSTSVGRGSSSSSKQQQFEIIVGALAQTNRLKMETALIVRIIKSTPFPIFFKYSMN